MHERTRTPGHSSDTIGSPGEDLSPTTHRRPDASTEEVRTVPAGTLDPFMTPCPDWCSVERHEMVLADVDRNHVGEPTVVSLRREQATWDKVSRTFTVPRLELFLFHNVVAAEPVVRAYLEDGREVVLTLGEAEQIGRALLALVEGARAV